MFSAPSHVLESMTVGALVCLPYYRSISPRQFWAMQILSVVGGTFGDFPILYNIVTNLAEGKDALEGRLLWVEPVGGLLHSALVTLDLWLGSWIVLRRNNIFIRRSLTTFWLSSLVHIVTDAQCHGVWPERPMHSYTFPSDFPLSKILGWCNYHPTKGSLPKAGEIFINVLFVVILLYLLLRYVAAKFSRYIGAFAVAFTVQKRAPHTQCWKTHAIAFIFSRSRGPPEMKASTNQSGEVAPQQPRLVFFM